jgi:asparagine synthase (glutamine-hydrolysing)
VTVSRFVGVFDRRRRLGSETATALADALGVSPGATTTNGSVGLAWSGAEAPSGAPLGFLDGHLYAGAPPVPAGRVAAELAARLLAEGDRSLRRLRGDFVLVCHDQQADELVLVRDQLGGRALFWHERDGRMVFASEVRYLLPLLTTEPRPDPVALGHWLALSGQPADRTLFEGVRRLEEGSILRAGAGVPVTRRYWDPTYVQPYDSNAEDCALMLRGVLREAVRRRTTGPAVTGVLLSGGLDSSSVAGTAAHLDPPDRPSRAYSATFPDHPSVDEGDLIALACERFGLTNTRAVVSSGSVVTGAYEYLEHWRLPPPSPNLFFWLPLLRRAAADGVDALLDGEGGDELFGLSPYLLADRVRHGRLRAAFTLGRRLPGGRPDLARSHVWPFVREFGLRGALPAGFHRGARHVMRAERYVPPWLGPELRAAFLDSDTTGEWKRLSGPRWWAYLVAACTRGLGAPITYDHVRRRNALAGLEPRHPLVDVDVVELVLGFPPELAFDTRHSRPLLRAAMRGWVPDELRLRPTKSTFDAVFHEALVADLELVRALLEPGKARLAPYVELDRVGAELLTAAPAPGGERQVWAQHLWRLLTAECWLRVPEPGGLTGASLPLGHRPVLDVRRHA